MRNIRLFAEFASLAIALPGVETGQHRQLDAAGIGRSLIAGGFSFVRMDYHSLNYTQTLFLEFLATIQSGREGGAKGEGGGGGGGGLPIGGLGRGGGVRGQVPPPDDDGV